MNETLYIDNIVVAYDDKTIIHNFSLQVGKGETIAVTGASGCGKSSLLKAILGIVPIKAGNINISEMELSAHNIYAFRKKTAYLPQELTFPCEWVHEMIALTFGIKANRGKENRELLHTYLNKLSLDSDICEKRLSEISGGQRQRIMIAVAALTNKDFILLDEPTSALDKESARKVLDFLNSLDNKPGIIAVTHDAEFASHCSRVVDISKYMYNGNN